MFPLSLSKSFEGLILEVTNTSGATKIDSSFSALTVYENIITTDKIKRFLITRSSPLTGDNID